MTLHLLETKGLNQVFGGLRAVSDVSFHVDEGEIVGVIGPNGAGKTTLFNTICGVLRPASGHVLFDGRPIQGMRPNRIARLGISRTFQTSRPFLDLSVEQNILASYGVRFHNSWRPIWSPFAAPPHREKVRQLLQLVDLERFAAVEAGELSLGLQRRLEIARALALEPRLLMLDEPAAGISHEEAEQLMLLIRRLREQGMTVLLIEHNMRLVMNLCDRIEVLSYGVQIAAGSPEEIARHPEVIEAYLGKDVADA